MKKIIRKWLEWYAEKEATKITTKYDKTMKKLEKKEAKLDRFYNKVDRWLEK